MIKVMYHGGLKEFANAALAASYCQLPDGGLLTDITWEADNLTGTDASSLIAYAATIAEAEAHRQMVRKPIAEKAGDTLTIVGTIADSAALQLECIGKLAHALAQSSDVNVAGIAQPISDMFADFMEKVESGEYRLTSTLKTPAVVLQDAGERSTAVNDVLAAHAANPE